MSVTMYELEHMKKQCEIYEKQLLECHEELQKRYEEISSLLNKVNYPAFDTLFMSYNKNELKAIGEIVQKCINAKSETIKEIDRLLVEVNNREEFGEQNGKRQGMIIVELEEDEDMPTVSARAYFRSTNKFLNWMGTFIEEWEDDIKHISCVKDDDKTILKQTYIIDVANIRKTMLEKFDEIYY